MTGRTNRAVAIGAAVLALLVTAFTPAVLNDPDSWWHVAAGQWMLDHRQVLREDVFSHTMAGTEWRTHEWLSEVLMALAHRLAGWSGVLALTALAAGAAMLLLGQRLLRSLGGLTLAVMLALSLACVAPSLLARPHILVLPLIVLWTAVLMRARDKGAAPHPAWALVLVPWANMHGSYLLAFVLLGAFGLEALIEAMKAREPKRLKGWVAFGALSLLAVLATPHGFAGLVHPVKLMGMTILPGITEWQASDFSRITTLEIALLAALFVALSRGVRVPVVRLALLLLLLHMSLQHARHALVLAVIAPMLLAEPFAWALGQEVGRAVRRKGLWIGFGVGALMIVGVRLVLPLERTDGPESPVAALASVPAGLREEPVLNEYGFGGYLIFSGVRPYIDGRADMYGDAFVADYLAMAAGDPARLDRALARYRIAWTLLPPEHPLTPLMDAKAGWRRLHADGHAVVHARTGPADGGSSDP